MGIYVLYEFIYESTKLEWIFEYTGIWMHVYELIYRDSEFINEFKGIFRSMDF